MTRRIRPLTGQLSLLGDPPVQYCGLCGHPLRSEASRKLGFGRRCLAIHTGRVDVRFYCPCGKRLPAGSLGCELCGRGFETGRLRLRRKLFPKSRKRKESRR